MAAAMQFLTRPQSAGPYDILAGDWRHGRVEEEQVWQKAVHQIATESLTPEQAADEAIARVKQILSE
jgi:hypothetical protein